MLGTFIILHFYERTSLRGHRGVKKEYYGERQSVPMKV